MAPKTPRTPKTPPSRILTSVEWKVCSTCHSTYFARDNHETACPTICSGQYFSVENHGFIHEKQLYGLIFQESCKECPSFQMKVEKANLVFLSPAVMQLCGIHIGSHIIVDFCGKKKTQSILTAWPCPHLHPTSVFIHTDVLKMLFSDVKHLLRIAPVEQKCTVAQDIFLKIEGENVPFDAEKLATAFLVQYEGHTVSKETCLLLKYFGQKWCIVVEEIGTTSTPSSNSSKGSVEEALEALSIEDSPVISKYSLVLPVTRINFTNLIGKSTESKVFSKISLADFGGSHDVVNEIKEICSSVFVSKKMNVPRGVLLYGPPGTGKSLLIRAVANHFNVKLVTIIGPELFSKYYGETESRIRDKFDEALKSEPCIILMDEVDALCPRRESSSSHNDQERRVVATLLSMLDSIPTQARVIVMGASNKPDALDPALRRPGRLDRELELRVPTVVERKEILTALLRKLPNALEPQDIGKLADVTHGFVGADLSLLCAEASLASAKRIIASKSNENVKDEDVANSVIITPEDTTQALHLVKPSAMREVLVEVPNVHWSDIGGQDELKLKLKQAVEWPIVHSEAFQRLGVDPPRGLLMFGPPGCSKTMIAKALATESGLNFIAVKGPELFSKWVGESERAVREVFRRARQVAPSIVFLDELDALGSARGSGSGSAGVADRVLAQLLTEMDGIEALKDVTVVAATNRPDMIDKALLRPGRLDRIVYVPLPDEATRKEILKLKFRSMPIHSEVAIDWLVDSTKGYSGAEVSAVCNEAALKTLEEGIKNSINFDNAEIRRSHFEFALTAVRPRITAATIAFYENYVKENGIIAI